MKPKTNSLLNVILIATLLISILAILPIAYAAPEVYMTPSANSFDTGSTAPGYEWDITFWVKDIPDPGAFAFQFKCFFDASFLQVVSAGTYLASADAAYIFAGKSTVQPSPAIDNATGNVLIGDSILVGAPTIGAGPFKLGVVRFRITAAPGKYESLYSDLDINNADTYLLNEALNEITPIIKTSGYVDYDWLPPATIPTVAVVPPSLTFDQYTNWTDPANSDFNVEVKLLNLEIGWALHNASLSLSYDPTLLSVLGVVVDAAWAGPNNVGVVPGTISIFVQGHPAPTGDVLVATISFRILFQGENPPQAVANTTALDIHDVILWDTVGTIDYYEQDGFVEIEPYLALPLPWLSVEPNDTVLGPELVIGQQFGQTFTIDVNINDLHFAWKLVGVQFRLSFDETLVEVLSVDEGDFLPGYATYGTFPIIFIEPPNGVYPAWHVLFGDLILPDGGGSWDWMEPDLFPDCQGSSGTLATITLKPLQQSWVDTLVGDFSFMEVELVDKTSASIPTEPSVDGTVTILPIDPVGRIIDVWMFDPALGGEGPGAPADLVLPQMGIMLTAKVTYNWQPISYKKVTFEIRGPFPHGEFEQGNLWAVLQDDTCDNGHAYAFFRMPWTGHDAEELIGTWGVMVSVTLADIVITDYMEFDYDYLINIWDVTTDKDEYYKCNDCIVTATFGTKSTREFDVTMYVTIQDELGVPITLGFATITVGGAQLCHYKNYTLSVTVHIETFAYAGLAEVRVSFVFGLPSEGGEAAGQELSTYIWILPLHWDDPWLVDP